MTLPALLLTLAAGSLGTASPHPDSGRVPEPARESPAVSLALGDSLFRHGFYPEAASEYRRCLMGQGQCPQPGADTAWLKLGLSLAGAGVQSEAADALHRAADASPALARPALLALAGAYVLSHSPGQARLEVSDLLLFVSDSASRTRLLAARAWIALQENDASAAAADLREAGLWAAAEALAAPRAGRSQSLAVALSSVVPGAGEAYAGRPWSGLLGFAVTGSTGLATYLSVRSGDWVTAAVLFSTLFLRFYNGSRRNAADFTAEYNDRSLRDISARLTAEYRLEPDWFEGVRWFTGPDFPRTESRPAR